MSAEGSTAGEGASAASAPRRAGGVDLGAWKGVWVNIELERGRVQPVSWELLGEGRKLADHLGVPLSGVVLGPDDAATRPGRCRRDPLRRRPDARRA